MQEGSEGGRPCCQPWDWEGGGARAEMENVGEAGLGQGRNGDSMFHEGTSAQTQFLLKSHQGATLLLDKWGSSSADLLG